MGTTSDIAALFIQETGAVLFGMVFLFLYRQSRAVYFGLWAIAWALRMLAAIFGYELMLSGNAGWLAPYATFEFAFVIVLIAAARAGFGSSMRDWRTVLRLIAILPIFVALVWAFGSVAPGRLRAAYHVSTAVVLAFVYIYNFVTLPKSRGVGLRAFRFSLLLLAATFLAQAVIFLLLFDRGPAWIQYLQHEPFSDFALHCALAFSAMAMWSEGQIDRIREISAELDHSRRETRQARDLDGLTGLLNRSALDRRLELPDPFPGVVAVCDMDNFSDINDRYGHLMGDEILRNIGKLLQASIRHEDEAYRWGGDEFAILFRNQQTEVARKRMTDIESRLREFRVRGSGVLPISFSWGIADGYSRPLRESLNEADHNMYARKRVRSQE